MSVVVTLPPDPADLARVEEPEPAALRIDVLDIARHVPSRVRVTFPEQPAGVQEQVATR